MKNIIFSVPLLGALGCDVKELGADFIKYKHVFFEVFTAKIMAILCKVVSINFFKFRHK